MRAKFSLCTLLFLLSSPSAYADDQAPWVVGGGESRIFDLWPSETNKVVLSEYPIDGGVRLCSVTISPRATGPARYFSVQQFQGQNGFTFVAYQEDWLLLPEFIFQISAVFDHKASVALTGTGAGQEIRLGADIGTETRINALLSQSKNLDVDFPGRPGLTWRIGLRSVDIAMSKLRLCLAKPPMT